jgi:predicted MFS family arabinose efflux permease
MKPVSRAYAWYVLVLLTALNLLNYVDRFVLVGMYDDLRARFGLSDAQIGGLTTAFFVVHAITTVPLGWAADRWDRRRILGLGVIVWSLATLGSGYALGFLSLVVLRGLVGVGEAAYGPIPNAVLCEVFGTDLKARIVGIFNGGMFAGLGQLPIDGTIVIGSEEGHELESASKIGTGGEAFDLAIDPLEGRGVVARGGNGAMSMIAVGPP